MDQIFAWIQQWDLSVFRFINQDMESTFLTWFLPPFTSLHTIEWIKFGLLPVGLFIWIFFQRRKAVTVVLALALAIGLADTIAYRGIKSQLKRPRPHHIESVGSIVRVNYGPKSGSFPSNHATSSAAAAVVLSYFYPALWPLFAGLAFVNGFSRVYVGVHFPSDVIAGWGLGALLGWFLMAIVGAKILGSRPRRQSIS